MAKFKKKEEYLEPVLAQEILAEEMNEPVEKQDLFQEWETSCHNMVSALKKLEISPNLIDETISSIYKTITLTRRVKAKVQ